MQDSALQPILLCIGGHDPCGGAGIQADLEAARAAGLFSACVISCLTTQDTCGLRAYWPQPEARIEAQCRLIFRESRVGAVKIGLLGSSRISRMLVQLADEYREIPWVLDPILSPSLGEGFLDAALLNQIRKHLLGRCTLITPNLSEARLLSGAKDPKACAQKLLETGCRWVLITSAQETEEERVVHRLYGQNREAWEWHWPRLPGHYHGSGCTLASAAAARLALGMEMVQAVEEAQRYTWESLRQALRTGRCQLTPNRFYFLNRP